MNFFKVNLFLVSLGFSSMVFALGGTQTQSAGSAPRAVTGTQAAMPATQAAAQPCTPPASAGAVNPCAANKAPPAPILAAPNAPAAGTSSVSSGGAPRSGAQTGSPAPTSAPIKN